MVFNDDRMHDCNSLKTTFLYYCIVLLHVPMFVHTSMSCPEPVLLQLYNEPCYPYIP